MISKVILYCAHRWFIPLLLLVTLLLAVTPTSIVSADAVVAFPDPNLEAAIREVIGKPTGDIYESDLPDVPFSLGVSGLGIVNLTGLEHCTNLVGLTLDYNPITNISPLSSLTGLRRLRLYYTQVSDISPLSSLASLSELVLAGTQISNITALSSLTGLEMLTIYDTRLNSVPPLSKLTSLTYLCLVKCQISDISPLSGLTSLKYLELGDNQIVDISPLSGLTSVLEFNLHSNQISDIEPLVNNQGLGSGDHVLLQGNPLNSASVNTWIPALQARGVTVSWDTANQPPNRPSNVSPVDGATAVSLTPTLTSSAFSDPDGGDAHAASHWQITATAGDYSSTVFDNVTYAPDLTSTAVHSGVLSYSTTYYWHVRHIDNHGDWSDWSTETSFSVAGRSPNQPSNIVPPTAATGVSLLATLQSSPFSDPDSGNSHSASQWQVREVSGSYLSPIYDSGTDRASLTIKGIPSGLLSQSTTYCWHVRYQDSTGLWSDWSAETFFVTESSTTDTNGGPPVWIWIVVGGAIVLTTGVAVYLVGRRRSVKQQPTHATVSAIPREDAHKVRPNSQASPQETSWMWWILPICLTWIGGLGAYLAVKDKNRKKAMWLGILGLVMIPVQFLVGILIRDLWL
jgi:hypothetical protein